MPTPTKGPRLGGSPSHERLILANLATALFEHGGITTTEAKAKRLRPYAERLVTFAKRGDLHARRRVMRVVRDKSVVHELFTEIGPRFADRPGGYTRITKLGPRKGDNAPMARIELVEGPTVAQEAVGEAERARGSRFSPRRRASGATAEAASELATASPTAARVAADNEADLDTDRDADLDNDLDTDLGTDTEADDVEARAVDAAAETDTADATAGAGLPDEGAAVDQPDARRTPTPVADESAAEDDVETDEADGDDEDDS